MKIILELDEMEVVTTLKGLNKLPREISDHVYEKINAQAFKQRDKAESDHREKIKEEVKKEIEENILKNEDNGNTIKI